MGISAATHGVRNLLKDLKKAPLTTKNDVPTRQRHPVLMQPFHGNACSNPASLNSEAESLCPF